VPPISFTPGLLARPLRELRHPCRRSSEDSFSRVLRWGFPRPTARSAGTPLRRFGHPSSLMFSGTHPPSLRTSEACGGPPPRPINGPSDNSQAAGRSLNMCLSACPNPSPSKNKTRTDPMEFRSGKKGGTSRFKRIGSCPWRDYSTTLADTIRMRPLSPPSSLDTPTTALSPDLRLS
jgi:hypothetical protein